MEITQEIQDRFIGDGGGSGGSINSGFTASPDVNNFIPGQDRSNEDLSRSLTDSSDGGRAGRTGDRNTPTSDNTGARGDFGSGRLDAQGDSVPSWNPDPNLSPEENINSLFEWLNMFFNTSGGNGINYATDFAGYLKSAYTSIYNMFHAGTTELEHSTIIELAEKCADMTYAFISANFQSALSYQSWYLQQDYNSPINQINRLAEAGLNTAFALGNVNSGNANSSAIAPQVQNPSPSNAGAIEQQNEAADKSFWSGLVSAGASLLPGMIGSAASAVNQLVQAKATKALTPLQVSQAGASIVNSAANYEYMRWQSDQIQQNMALDIFQNQMSASSQIVQQSREAVDTAKNRYDTYFNNYSEEYEECAYEVKVVTKEGKVETRTLSIDETKELISNGGKFEDGSTVVGVSSWDKFIGSDGKMKGGLDIPALGFEIGAEGSISANDQKHGSESTSNNTSTTVTTQNDKSSSKQEQGYSSDGKSFTIGNTKFTSVTHRKRLPLPEHANQIKKLFSDWQNLYDRYNALTTGEHSRLQMLLDNLTRNLSNLS